MIVFKLQPKYYQQILAGQKTVEGRIAKQKYKSLSVGDIVSFVSNDNQTSGIKAQVLAVTEYPDFAAMLKSEGVSKMLPGITTIQEGVGVYESLGSFKQQVVKHGCIAIRFEVI